MKTTIKAKVGYKVRRGVVRQDDGTERPACRVNDGDEIIMIAYLKTFEDHKDDMVQNECYHVCEVFETVKGNKFIYARDEEIDEDYVIQIPTTGY